MSPRRPSLPTRSSRSTGKRARIAALVGAVCLATVASLTSSAGATLPAGQTFNPTGNEQSYTVPAGVTLLHVELVGGGGAAGTASLTGSGGGGNGGAGAEVNADLPVTAGETLYVEVGEDGQTAATTTVFGGGAAAGGSTAGGGGGASDVRTCSIASCDSPTDSLNSRLLVAAGGGGGGGGNPDLVNCPPASTPCPGGAGGAHDVGGSRGTGPGAQTAGGGPGTATTPGDGGTGGNANSQRDGVDGSLGTGGAGGPGDGGADGGGGGGGLYGGGGGGADNDSDTGNNASGGGGGGGGSSFVDPSATNASITTASSSPQITVTPIGGVPEATTGGASPTSTNASLTGTATANGLPTVYYAEYGLDQNYGSRSASVLLSAQDGASHAVTVKLAGLSPGTLFHYRIVATNSAGTAYGADQTFLTHSALVAGIAVATVRTVPPRAIVPIFTNMTGNAWLTATPLHSRVNYGHGKKVRCRVRRASKKLAPHNGGLVISALVGGCSYHLQLTMASDGQTASDTAFLQVFRIHRPKRHR